MPFRWNPITSNFDLTEEPPAGTGDVFHADPLTNNKVVLGAGTDFIKVSGIEVDASDNMSLVNTLSVVDIATTQQNLDLEPDVDIQAWSAILDQFALLSPTAGDVIYADGDPKWTVLPKGTDGEVLKLVGGFPEWVDDNPISGTIGASNLALTYSSGTTTIRGANGNALSSTNPAYLTLVSNANSDQLITVKLESNKTFNDSVAGSSVFAGSLFDFDTGDDSGTTEIPFYLYVILDDNDANPIFAISRVPNLTITSVSTFFNAASGSADGAIDMLALENVTTTNYDSNNALLVGIITMDINGSDDWIVRKVDTSDIGIGRFGISTKFTVPLGTRGTASNSLFIDNGGTAPTVQSGLHQYKIDPFSGTCTISYDFVLGGSPAGNINTEMLLPLDGNQSSEFIFSGATFIGGTSGNVFPVYYKRNSQIGDERFLQMRKGDGTTARWQHAEFTSGDFIFASHTYLL